MLNIIHTEVHLLAGRIWIVFFPLSMSLMINNLKLCHVDLTFFSLLFNAGVATAFAGRDILGNVLSGLSMQFSKPFSLGDTIKVCLSFMCFKELNDLIPFIYCEFIE